MVTGAGQTRWCLSVYEILFNQRKPTIPITADPEVGRRLALASKTNSEFNLTILVSFIPSYLLIVNKSFLKIFEKAGRCVNFDD